jgi:hypothetical protein
VLYAAAAELGGICLQIAPAYLSEQAASGLLAGYAEQID